MFKFKLVIPFLIVFGLFSLTAGNVFAMGEVVGKVVAARGDVLAIDSSGGQRALKTKAEIHTQDVVKTGKNGRVQMIFSDNTIISLGVDSTMDISEYRWDANAKSGAMKTRVQEGTFRVLGGMITKTSPESFTTETPAATIGIRGSMYAGRISGNQLSVVFLGGTGIYVENPFGIIDIMEPGFGLTVEKGIAPGPPEPVKKESLDKLVEGLASDQSQSDSDKADVQVSETTTDFEQGMPAAPNLETISTATEAVVIEVDTITEEATTTESQDAIIEQDPHFFY